MHFKPDYNGGSIINLMSTVSKAFGKELQYPELRTLASSDIKNYKNIVNIVIDGLGFNFLSDTRSNILKNNIYSSLTSVFPSTTSACITSFATGLAPRQHGVTGWFVRIREKGLDIPSTILLFNDRRNEKTLTEYGLDPRDVFIDFRLSSYLPDVDVVLPEKINKSVYSEFMLSNAEKHEYSDMKGFFNRMREIISKDSIERRYIYSYFPDLDSVYHSHGRSPELMEVFNSLLTGTEEFIKDIKGSNTLVLITADHGLIEGEKGRRLNMNELPVINRMLEFPLCGEPRAAYCYVKDEFKSEFKKTVEKEIGYAFEVFERDKMIKDGYFGLYESNPSFRSRTGDFILISKEDYVIRDFLPNEKLKFNLADHGGLSGDEMLVPLIMLET